MAVKIALAQYPISWFGSLAEWSRHIEHWVKDGISSGAKILVFPEYASMEMVSWFEPAIQADLHRQLVNLQMVLPSFLDTFRHLAKAYDCILVAPSFPVKLADGFVNRCFVFSPQAEGHQDKWFMTRFENEVWGIGSLSKELTVFEADWGKFGIQICYDIEFPIGAQMLAANGADLILAPSCTETIRGATRVHVGARARALEQQIFVAVSQTINEALWSPAVDINYGFAAVYGAPDAGLPQRGILKSGKPQNPSWVVQKLDFSKNEFVKSNGQVFNSKDMATIQMNLSQNIRFVHVKL